MKKFFLALFLSLVLFTSVFASTGSDTVYYNGQVYKIADLPVYYGKVDWSQTKIISSDSEEGQVVEINGTIVVLPVE